jgi:hypothetical protein
VLGEALGTDPLAVPEWVGRWLREVLPTGGRAPLPPELLDLLDAHHHRLRGHVDGDLLREVFRTGGRLDRWILREGTALLEAADRPGLEAFVRWAESERIEPAPAGAEILARAADRAGRGMVAVELARFVLEHDPYAVECARLLAEHHERVGEIDLAVSEAERVRTLDPADTDARHRVATLRHRVREAARPAPPDPAELPDDPNRLLAMTRELVAAGDHESALVAARKLSGLAPEFEAAAGAMIESLETLAQHGAPSGGQVRVILDPLDDRSYRETPSMALQQVAELLPTPLGRHPILHEELVRLLREKGASEDQIRDAETQLAQLVGTGERVA